MRTSFVVFCLICDIIISIEGEHSFYTDVKVKEGSDGYDMICIVMST